MKKIKEFLRRLKMEFIKVNVLEASLDALIFFLGMNFLLSIFSINLTSLPNIQSVGILTVILFLGDLHYRTRKYRLEIYEEKNQEFREILRTARDNLHKQTTGSEALFQDLLRRARSVTSDSIVPNKEIIYKILAVGGLSFLVVLSGLTSIQLNTDSFQLLPDVNTIQEQIGIDGDDDEEFRLRNASEVLGESEQIDTERLNLEFNITGESDTNQQEDTFEFYRGSQESLVLETSRQSLSDDLQLAKQYSLAIRSFDG